MYFERFDFIPFSELDFAVMRYVEDIESE